MPAFSDLLLRWYDRNRRSLPWRGQTDPYRIWISEIMLQQTRAEAVISYYIRFLNAFPDVAALACAEQDEVLKLWEGLGYYTCVLRRGACILNGATASPPMRRDCARFPESDRMRRMRLRRSPMANAFRRSTAIRRACSRAYWRMKRR